MKRKILILLAIAVIAGLFIGCGGSKEEPAAAAKAGAAEDMTFVIVPKCVHAWFDEVNKGAVLQAEALSQQLGVTVKN